MQATTLTSTTTNKKAVTFKVGFASGDRIAPHLSPDGTEKWGGSGWARLGQYVGCLDMPTIVGTLVWDTDHFYIRDANDNMVDVEMVVLQRLMHDSLSEKIQLARAYGQIIVNDLDDWYWGLDPKNDAFKSSHPKQNPKENRNHYKSVLGSSDFVIVSTSYIKERISAWVRCPIVVLKNTIDVGRFSALEHGDNLIPRVGWAGSTSHRSGDLEMVRGIIKPMLNNGEITFQHSGHSDHATPVHKVFEVSDDQVLRVPLVEPIFYPSSMTMDVGIAPLRDTPFNHAKSDIKALEYSAAGIPWVASPMTAYKELVEEWGVGRLAKNGQQWLKHLRALKDPELRALEGASLREKAWTRDIESGAHALRQTLIDFSNY